MRKAGMFILILAAVLLVYTGCPNNAAPTTPTEKKNTEWLFLMYMAAEGNLADLMWKNIKQAEKGLAKAQNKSISVVVLWDAGNEGVEPTPKGSALYELAGDDSTEGGLSKKIKNLSSTAPWLSSGSVDTGNKSTLVNFLNWAKKRYSATNTVLVFSNHGGGPRSMSAANSYQQAGSRAMCWDEGTNNFLSTKDVSTAFNEVGYGEANKLGMIMLDVCLGSSIEDAYQFRNYAKYMIASPNVSPGGGFDYVKIIGDLTSSSTLESVGKKQIDDYKTLNTMPVEGWDTYVQPYYPTVEKKDLGLHYSLTINTSSFIDLSKMDGLKTAFDEFSLSLSNAAADRDALKRDFAAAHVPYVGTYTWLYDVGYLVQDVATKTTNDKLKAAATKVEDALKTVILKSWRDGYSEGKTYFGEGLPYGLTICGETAELIHPLEQPFPKYNKGYFLNFYTAEYLDFAAGGKWAEILKGWYPAKPNP